MALVTSGVVPDWPGLQHEIHIIVPFLLLFPSVLLLPDVIRFSNLDAQTHQEPQNIKKSLETPTQVYHTHKWDALPTDSSAMPVTLVQTYVALNTVPSPCNPFMWDSHSCATYLINLSGLRAPYIMYSWNKTIWTSACQEQSHTDEKDQALTTLHRFDLSITTTKKISISRHAYCR